MRKIFAVILILVLVCNVLPTAHADSLFRAEAAKDSIAFYTIGNSAHTFDAIYNRMHIYLDLNNYPIPDPVKSDYSYVTGAHDEFTVLKDDDDSFDYIGYVCGPDGNRIFIVWSWSGYHEDGSLIGVDSYYALNGVYLGAIQRDYTTGAAISSGGSPFFYNVGSLNGKA